MQPSLPVLCGVSGWQYEHWNRTVYPNPQPPGFHRLAYLAERLDTVEIDLALHDPPRPEIVRLWLRQVEQNPRFRFQVRLDRRLTHGREIERLDFETLRRTLEPLAEARRLGMVLMEFPWAFRFTEENRSYFERLRRALPGMRLAAEMRHASWMCEEALGVFIDHRVCFVNIDQPPHIKAMPPGAHLTAPVGYIRLHGRDGANWFRQFGSAQSAAAASDYLYSAVELAEWVRRIERLRAYASEVYVVFHNDAKGKAVVNALQMRAMTRTNGRVARPRAVA